MILILSDTTDESTCKVMDWIRFLKPSVEVIRISPADKITQVFISNDTIIITFNKWNDEVIEIDFAKVTAYWYRRGKLDFNRAFFKPFLSEQLGEYERNELDRINAYIHHALKKIKSLNSRSNVAPNKLIVNDLANSCGLIIPQYIISSEKQRLLSFSDGANEVITKGIDESIYMECEDGTVKGYTEKLSRVLLDNYNEDIFPSLLQEHIDKKYEVRVFYLNAEFYSMAIFSQRDEQTQVDFRKYNLEKPNRCVPFQLPKEIEHKLKTLMDKLDLNSGSIDLIVDKNNDYVFLEVNPVGQFAMVSEPCNYFLEKKVAEFLIN